MIAAAISVYVAANSRREDLKHLCFFALTCGIAFPAILLKTIDPAALQSQKQIESAKVIATDPGKPVQQRAEAAQAIANTVLESSPAKSVDAQTQAIITNNLSTTIKTLQGTNSLAGTDAAKGIFDAAQSAGYTAVVAPQSRAIDVPQTQPQPQPSQ
jgi:hypothetical protein